MWVAAWQADALPPKSDCLHSLTVVMLMYYAPWCAQCQETRWHMDKLARHFSVRPQVRFVAINCWDPGGRCKQTYKLYTYPVLAVFPGSTLPVFYTGQISVVYLYRFLDLVFDPFVRLQNRVDVENFFASGDIFVIAFFDFLSFADPPGYLSYHKSALRFLEKAATLVDYCCHPDQTSTTSKLKLDMDNVVFDKNGNLIKSEKKVKCNRRCLSQEDQRDVYNSDANGCQRLRLAKLLGHNLFSDLKFDSVFDSEAPRGFYGLGCETNRTLRFIAMDSVHYSWLAEKLVGGGDRQQKFRSEESKLVIAENSTESVFVLNQNLTLSSVRDFVNNFTLGQLETVLKGEENVHSKDQRK